MSKEKNDVGKAEELAWHGRPSVGAYIIIFGLFAIVSIVILVTLEYAAAVTSSIGRSLFPSSIRIGGALVPYPVEIATTIIIVLYFVFKVMQLSIVWATNRYDLEQDGLYINHGIINLENTFVAPMAFSDARLVRTWLLRIAGRGLIIVEANDGRRFYLKYVEDPQEVQSRIRRTLSHPTVRTE